MLLEPVGNALHVACTTSATDLLALPARETEAAPKSTKSENRFQSLMDRLQRPEDRLPSRFNSQNKTGDLPNEQTQRKQMRAAKDDPVLTELLETALEKLASKKQPALYR
eukprot:6491392-Amphidinium_carterae.3